MGRNWRKKVSIEVEAIEQELSAWFEEIDSDNRNLAIEYFIQQIEEFIGKQRSRDVQRTLEYFKPKLIKEISTKKAQIYQRAMAVASRVPNVGQDEVSRSQFSEQVILPNIVAWCRLNLIEQQLSQMNHNKKPSKVVKVAAAAGGITLAALVIGKIVKQLGNQQD